jgi:hypothetical protein
MRHSHKSLMAELRTPEVLSHERLGHELGGVAGRYSHVTAPMREELMSQLTERWEQALAGRAAISPRSPGRCSTRSCKPVLPGQTRGSSPGTLPATILER